MTTKHTPGPWEAVGWTILTEKSPRSNGRAMTVGSVFDHGDDHEAFANARLMAAAPEMLDALEALLKHTIVAPAAVIENAVYAVRRAKGQ